MALTDHERMQLQARAAGLREEVSTKRAEADAALQEKAQEINDEKLIAEVMNLEAAREAAVAARDRVTSGSASDAIALMNSVVGAPENAEGISAEAQVLSTAMPTDNPAAPSANTLGDPFAEGGSN